MPGRTADGNHVVFGHTPPHTGVFARFALAIAVGYWLGRVLPHFRGGPWAEIEPCATQQNGEPLYDESSERGVESDDSLRAGRHLLKAECDLFDEYFRAERLQESR